ncbi:hypothetical protein C7446_1754 [Kushneria sinocarnis]|uniref:Cytokinin riboside 5'-monophosphate phosphoribohydrolase n=1 Tax=Kushneria sinocarnis TaxID=595502 RepID=A0A420WXS9_9GAMM|nr:TIGR00730 family Rossman fold protein [Kushneria sinocarnis]RKR04544.1 hypothetical protein C7446_1754 [Kushneria sinocarnis]
MTAICVYMGSRDGHHDCWRELAEAMGREIGRRGWRLVYGGGSTGLMGRCADATLAAGGRVTGVIPGQLVEREVAHPGLSELIEVPDMHTRKARMASRADAFVVLPGGIGTLEEFFETWTWQYLGLHDKQLGLLQAGDFFTPLLQFLDTTVAAGFLDRDTRNRLIVEHDPATLLDRLAPSGRA